MFLKPHEVAEMLRVSVRSLQRTDIPHFYLHPTTRREKRYRMSDIEAFIESQQKCPSPSEQPKKRMGRKRSHTTTTSSSQASGFKGVAARLIAEKRNRSNERPAPAR